MTAKAIIVDDEIHILRNLSQVIAWAELGVEIVALAKNGVDALAAIKTHQPDLILSDIRMPAMDGLTLLKEVRELGLTSEILLLTGYQEFSYAQTAIRYGVYEYICKPINYEELEQTVQKVVLHIEEKKQLHLLEQNYGRIAQQAMENYLLHCLLGYKLEERFLLPLEEQINEPTQGRASSYLLYLLDAKNYTSLSMNWVEAKRTAWNVTVKNKLLALLHDHLLYIRIVQVREGEWCIIAAEPFEHHLQEVPFLTVLEQLQDEFAYDESLQFMLAKQLYMYPSQQLAAAYQQLQLEFLWQESTGVILEVSNRLDEERELPLNWLQNEEQWQWIELISKGMRSGNHQLLQEFVTTMNSRLLQLNYTNIGKTEKLLNYILIFLLREMREQQMLTKEEEENMWHSLQLSLPLRQLQSVVVSLIEQCCHHLASKKNSELLMQAAEHYIQKNLANDFGIEEISSYLEISGSYFCLLFKNHFQETFVEHLTRKRMETAKLLLSSSDKSVSQIGTLVGYYERRYFSKVFQKHTGVTPSEYRLQCAE